jgi:hypothetical protein
MTNSAAGIADAMAVVVARMAAGEATPEEATTVIGILDAKRKAIELTEIEARIQVCWRQRRANESGHTEPSRLKSASARNMARDIAKTDAYLTSRRERKKNEMLFLKRILQLGRLRLRGPNGAHDEFHLAATAQNLRKLAKLRAPVMAIA